MATNSKSFGNRLSLFDLAVGGATIYKDKLPMETEEHAAELSVLSARARTLNIEQEAAKQKLKNLTAELDGVMSDATERRGKIVKFAEGTFGSRSSEMDQFRPKTEGKLRKPSKKDQMPEKVEESTS